VLLPDAPHAARASVAAAAVIASSPLLARRAGTRCRLAVPTLAAPAARAVRYLRSGISMTS
jgi:hypothetical protein